MIDEIDTIVKKNLSNDAGMCRHYMTLWSFIIGIEAKNVFEFGSGFSTLTMLSALAISDGKLSTMDIRAPVENGELNSPFGEQTINRHGSRWTFYHGDSLSSFNNIGHDSYYDMVLHDGTHTGSEVPVDLNNIFPYIKNGGFVLVHDTNHPELGEEMSSAVQESVLGITTKAAKFSTIKLPWGYGMTLIKVENNNPSINLKWKKE